MKIYIVIDDESSPKDAVYSIHVSEKKALKSAKDLDEMTVGGRVTYILEHEFNDIDELIELKCKETAKNVRHKACDIVNGHISRMEAPAQITSDIDRDIMNIQFDDVKPSI